MINSASIPLQRQDSEMAPYVWAKHAARRQKQLSVDLLINALGLSSEIAVSLLERLTREGILLAPDAMGIHKLNDAYIPVFQRKNSALNAYLQGLDALQAVPTAQLPTPAHLD